MYAAYGPVGAVDWAALGLFCPGRRRVPVHRADRTPAQRCHPYGIDRSQLIDMVRAIDGHAISAARANNKTSADREVTQPFFNTSRYNHQRRIMRGSKAVNSPETESTTTRTHPISGDPYVSRRVKLGSGS